MLSPDYLERCTDEVIKLYDELSDMILRDIVDRLISLDFEASATAAWRMEKLQELGRLTYADALREIAKMTGKTEQALKKAFENAGTESMRFDNSVYKKAGLSPLPLAQSDGMLQVLTAGYKKCRGSLKNLTLTTANTAQSSFIQACNAAYMQVTSGAFSVNRAVKTAVASVGQSGTWVLYPTGHRDRLDVAVRTGVAQTCGQLQIQQLDDMMWDVVDTTAHADARESHTVWQGGRFSYKGRNPNYPDFEEATGYGSADGLMGINCRHGFFPAVDGSPRMYPKAQLTEWKNRTVTYNGTEYAGHEAVSMQRAYERGIRATKRELTALDEGAKASKDEVLQRELSEAFSQTSLKLKRQEAALNDFLEQTGLKPEYERSQVREFDRRMSGKAKAAARKELTAEREKGIIKERGSGLDMHIDKFTPCLEERKTGKILPTTFSAISKEERKHLQGWKFNWLDSNLEGSEVYKLTLKGSTKPEGLVALKRFERDRAVYIDIVEAAPHNLGKDKQYNGVGGHLYAIAAKKSVEYGYGGFLFMDAKNMELVEHYQKTLGAILLGRPHPYRMIIDEEAAMRLLKIYTMEEG